MYPVTKDVTNIDLLYEYFAKELKDLFLLPFEEIRQIFLLPQGGIDQINTALTLKIIEHFKGKVTQLQNAENSEVIALDFPRRFIQNLNKHKVLELVKNYDFVTRQSLVPPGTICLPKVVFATPFK